tara:strand:- start:69 stop:416 length:348 start_codon:yes stop_codon:yes gene_type:complete
MSKLNEALSKIRFVNRTVYFDDPSFVKNLLPHISRQRGIINTLTDGKKLMISYDAEIIQWDSILKIMKSSNINPRNGFFTSLKSRWYTFVDHNIKDHVQYLPQSNSNSKNNNSKK